MTQPNEKSEPMTRGECEKTHQLVDYRLNGIDELKRFAAALIASSVFNVLSLIVSVYAIFHKG